MEDWLFDFQEHLADWTIRKGKGALFADCGLGKGPLQLVFAENVIRKTNKPFLILAPLAVSQQFVREGEKFGLEVHRSRDGRLKKGINVTNYERLHYFDPSKLGGVSADESGILKHFDTSTRKKVTGFMRGIDYRLLATATPAPNDFMELGSSSESLGVMKRGQMLGMFFSHCGDSTQQWELKGHAKRAFWKWVATWARSIRKPSDFGYDDGDFTLLPMETKHHILPTVSKGRGLVYLARTLNEQRFEKRASLKIRCEKVASLVPDDRPSVVWCHYNPEGDLLEKLIPGAVQVAGRHKDEVKEERLVAFSKGEIKTLITKPKIGGWGLNWQHCSDVFCFPSHCYDEETELLTKRGWLRFGKVNKTDEVGTVNPNTLAFEWQIPEDVIWSPYSGDMIRFGNNKGFSRSFDLLVTPNHRMFVKRCSLRFPSDDGGWRFVEAGQLEANWKRQEYRMLSTPLTWDGSGPEIIKLPPYQPRSRVTILTVNRSGNKRGLSINSINGLNCAKTVSVPSLGIEEFVHLAGWYLSEGCIPFRKGILTGSLVISQSRLVNSDYHAEIVSLLSSIPNLKVNVSDVSVSCCSSQLAFFLADQFGVGSYNKRIPTWVKELPINYLLLLRDTMLKGDGCKVAASGGCGYYRTVSKELADDFAEICLKTGLRGSVRYRENTGNEKPGRYSSNGFYDVNIARINLEPSIHQKPQRVAYKGMVGCVTVPNGTLLIRRNGIPVVSGNSYEQFYQTIRRCWRFGQKRKVMVNLIATEAEHPVIRNMLRKERQLDEMFAGIIREMGKYQIEQKSNGNLKELELPSWL